MEVYKNFLSRKFHKRVGRQHFSREAKGSQIIQVKSVLRVQKMCGVTKCASPDSCQVNELKLKDNRQKALVSELRK